jgi:hypothetical protein
MLPTPAVVYYRESVQRLPHVPPPLPMYVPPPSFSCSSSTTVSSHEVWMRDGDGSSIAMSHGISRPSPYSSCPSMLTEYWDCIGQLLYLSQTVAVGLYGAWIYPGDVCLRRRRKKKKNKKKKEGRKGDAPGAGRAASVPTPAIRRIRRERMREWIQQREKRERARGRAWAGVSLSQNAICTDDIVNCVGLMDKPVKDTIELLPSLSSLSRGPLCLLASPPPTPPSSCFTKSQGKLGRH